MSRDEKGDDQIKAVSFAAGMSACMACIQRAIVVSVFVHWRVWAFLALNLLLLAILFTSKSQNIPTDLENGGKNSDFSKKKKKKKTNLEREVKILTNNGGDEKVKLPMRVDTLEQEVKNEKDHENKENDENKKDYDELSKEELNQRVEDFIAMFRQHLVSDAKGKNYVSHCLESKQVNSPQRLSFSYSNKTMIK